MSAKIVIIFITIVSSFLAMAQIDEAPSENHIAKIVMLRGVVIAKTPSSAGIIRLKNGMWLEEGSLIQTGEKSFVRFLFIDKSLISLGPLSQMKITLMKKNRPGILELFKGRMRTQFLKLEEDRENGEAESKTKLIIRTPTASMGVRGTDFEIFYNFKLKTTTVWTYSGEVAFAKTPTSVRNNFTRLSSRLESSKITLVTPGTFSSLLHKQPLPSLPIKISPAQMYAMRTNINMETVPATATHFSHAVLPPDAPSENFAVVPAGLENTRPVTGEIVLRAGGYIDINTGHYLPPPAGSVFDPVSNVFIPHYSIGHFDASTGGFIPPEGFALDDSGQLNPVPEGGLPSQQFARPVYGNFSQQQQDWDRALDLMNRRENRDLYNAPPPPASSSKTKTRFIIHIQ
jgi:hypothetical protein